MKAIQLVVACIVLAGCSAESSSNDTKQDTLRGKWLLDIGGACLGGLVFDGQDYEADILCRLEDGTWGVEAETGSYAATDSEIDFVPERASCVMGDRNYDPYSMNYTVSPDVLRLTTPEGLLLFDRFADDPNDLGPQGGAVASYGCVEDDGFYDGEIVPVN